MDYHTYISSSHWKAKRQERLDFDGHRCAICHHDGSLYPLSVHHLHYETLGDEDVQHDLLTACSRCHRWLDTIERYQRYQRRERTPDVLDAVIQERTDVHGMAKVTVSVEFSVPTDHAQRADRRPIEQVRHGVVRFGWAWVWGVATLPRQPPPIAQPCASTVAPSVGHALRSAQHSSPGSRSGWRPAWAAMPTPPPHS